MQSFGVVIWDISPSLRVQFEPETTDMDLSERKDWNHERALSVMPNDINSQLNSMEWSTVS